MQLKTFYIIIYYSFKWMDRCLIIKTSRIIVKIEKIILENIRAYGDGSIWTIRCKCFYEFIYSFNE